MPNQLARQKREISKAKGRKVKKKYKKNKAPVKYGDFVFTFLVEC